jgi:hypothetical protein
MSDKVEKIKFVSIYSIAQKSFVCEYYTVEKYQSFHEEYIGFINDNLLMKPITEKQSVYGMWRTKCDEQFYYIGTIVMSVDASIIFREALRRNV